MVFFGWPFEGVVEEGWRKLGRRICQVIRGMERIVMVQWPVSQLETTRTWARQDLMVRVYSRNKHECLDGDLCNVSQGLKLESQHEGVAKPVVSP